jgi:NAD(P)-dependent dehydrogenase (short-subunit alcohol dehydrogenase family)
MKLADRSAIITGASRGLGKEIARQFVREGASVLLVARSAGPLRKAEKELRFLARGKGQQVLSHAGDVSDPEGCAAVAERAFSTFGGLTALVNNAGIQGMLGRLEEVPWEEWARVIAVNLFGPALLCRAVIPALCRRGYGKIVNLSGGGATKPMAGMSAYAASKAAVVRLTENLALDLRGDGVDVNAVAPGALNTRMLDEVLASGPEKVGEAYYEGALRQRESGGASLEKAAALVVFLASAASDGISGRLISAVWDDWSRLPERREQLAGGDVYTLRRVTPEDRSLSW